LKPESPGLFSLLNAGMQQRHLDHLLCCSETFYSRLSIPNLREKKKVKSLRKQFTNCEMDSTLNGIVMFEQETKGKEGFVGIGRVLEITGVGIAVVGAT